MNLLLNLGRGKLTYTLAVVGLAWAVLGFLNGNLDQNTAFEVIWLSLAAFGLRRAVK